MDSNKDTYSSINGNICQVEEGSVPHENSEISKRKTRTVSWKDDKREDGQKLSTSKRCEFNGNHPITENGSCHSSNSSPVFLSTNLQACGACDSEYFKNDYNDPYHSEYEEYPYSDSEVQYVRISSSLPDVSAVGCEHEPCDVFNDVDCQDSGDVSQTVAQHFDNISTHSYHGDAENASNIICGCVGEGATQVRSVSVDEGIYSVVAARQSVRGHRHHQLVLHRRRLSHTGPRSALNPRSRTPGLRPRTPLLRRRVIKDDDALSEGSDASSTNTFSIWTSTREEKLMLLILAIVELSSWLGLAVMAPFFPQEAALKGVSSSVSGWIFGIYALVQCVAFPIYGKILPHTGTHFLILAGQFFGGGCCVLFGLLAYVPVEPNNRVFVSLAFLLRIAMAIGCSASGVASFSMIAYEFSDSAATVFGMLEMASGLGLMLGPALGGVLYEVGGFSLPFIVLGGFMLATIPVAYCLLPNITPELDDNRADVGLLDILSIPAIWVIMMAIFVGAVAWSILDPTLAPHLEVFNLSPSMLGLVFLLMSAFYALSSPLWGCVCDKVDDSSPLLALGFFVCTGGFLLLGPSPLLQLEENYHTLWLNLVALSILGVSISLSVIPTFDKILDTADKAGLDDTLAMYSIVAGIWGSIYALGDFAGPTLGGMLLEKIGFAWTMTWVAFACFFFVFDDHIIMAHGEISRPITTAPMLQA